MENVQPPEVTVEEIGDDMLDPYELVRCEVHGRYILVVVRDKSPVTILRA